MNFEEWVIFCNQRLTYLKVLKNLKDELQNLIKGIRPDGQRKVLGSLFVNETQENEERRMDSESEIFIVSQAIYRTQKILARIDQKLYEYRIELINSFSNSPTQSDDTGMYDAHEDPDLNEVILPNTTNDGTAEDNDLFQESTRLMLLTDMYASSGDEDVEDDSNQTVGTHSGYLKLLFGKKTSSLKDQNTKNVSTQTNEIESGNNQPSTSDNLQGIADTRPFFRPNNHYEDSDSD
jgi:hypothetical protein